MGFHYILNPPRMYVVFIVINVSKLLYVMRPTSSPRAVWNPCKIIKALN